MSGQRASSVLQDPAFDTDGDGRCDLLEYALGLDPFLSDADRPDVRLEVSGSADERIIRIGFVRRRHRDELVYIPEISADLRDWRAVPLRIESATVIDSVFEWVTGRLVGDGGRMPGASVRLRVEYRPVDGGFDSEDRARSLFAETPIRLEGSVIDAEGVPVASAVVTVDPNVLQAGDEIVVRTGGDGRFIIPALPRWNYLLGIDAPGFRREIVVVPLHLPVAVEGHVAAPIRLRREDSSEIRFLFAGDTAFGRRFVNPLSTSEPDDPDRWSLPEDHADALIQVSDPLPGAIECVAFVRPLFDNADYPVINLETPVLRDPSTPHPDKSFAFYSLPETLGALTWLGVEYVALGNNHTFDYLDAGVHDTLNHVAAAGLRQSGLGIDAESAFRPFVKVLRGSPYAFLAACSVSGSQNPPLYIADTEKAGAADLRDDVRVRAAITDAAASGQIVIAQLHTGKEYSSSPSDYARDRMHLAVDSGASLVVGHHTHVAQGFEIHEGVLVIHCLGNFVFDQQRLETLLGLAVQVDMRGSKANAASAIPVYLEDYRPRLLAGDLANRFLRKVASVSEVPVVPDHGRGRVAMRADEYDVRERAVRIPVEIGPRGWTVVDLRRWADSDEFVSLLSAPGADLTGRLGRDILIFGGMEESDVDESVTDGDASRWWRAGGAYRGLNHPFAGAVALYSTGSRRLPEVLAAFSVNADEVGLADGHLRLDSRELALFDATREGFSRFRRGPSTAGEVGIGDPDFFAAIAPAGGNVVADVDIDALFLHDDGRVSFSTATDYHCNHVGIIKDGSVATYDPTVPLNHPDALSVLVDEDVLFADLPGGGNNNQDIDALHIDAEGRLYLSTTTDGMVTGLAGPPLAVRDGDVFRFDPATGLAEIHLSESELFTDDADIDAFSFAPDGAPVFSVDAVASLAGSGVRLVDGAVGRYDRETGTASAYFLQSDLFHAEEGAQADLNALHLLPHPEPAPSAGPRPQIAFRNRIRVEGDADNQPNKDLTALGYLWLDNNGPLSITATFHASFGDKGPEVFGSQSILEDEGGGSAAWRFFAEDLALPPDDPAAIRHDADNARAVRLFLFHEEPVGGGGLAGLDEMAVVNWEVDAAGRPVVIDLDGVHTISRSHDRDFIRVEGAPGIYQLDVRLRRLTAR